MHEGFMEIAPAAGGTALRFVQGRRQQDNAVGQLALRPRKP